MITCASQLFRPRRVVLVLVILVFMAYASSLAHGQAVAEPYAVTWDSLGKGYRDSMPIGNGDLGMNLWTEPNGDVVFLIGKTDSWSENGQLDKLGRVRVKLTPNPFTRGTFRQTLKPRAGAIEISGGGGTLTAWIDANHPVIHFEFAGANPVSLEANLELWRLQARPARPGNELWGQGALRELNGIPGGAAAITIDPDTVLPAQNGQVAWCHHNSRSTYPLVLNAQHLQSLAAKYPDPLLNRTWGAVMKGPGLVTVGNQTLKSEQPQASVRLDVYALTQTAATAEVWQKAITKMIAQVDAVDMQAARAAHGAWWDQFWNRSWIHITGDASAEKVTQGYAMQRWMMAGAGRGACAMKYNGATFTVGQEPPPGTAPNPASVAPGDPDHRNWGGNYWFQNERHLYWPMLAAGDYDLLQPFFNMYLEAMPLSKDVTRLYFKHDGAFYIETMYFFGLPNNNDFGWNNPRNITNSPYMHYYTGGALELTCMMLDRFDNTQDAEFVNKTLLPLAVEITTYYDQHWKRDASGKIRFDPSQAIETRQTAVNAAPDIAALMNVLPRLIALPQNLITESQRAMWRKTLADLPPLPRGKTDAQGKHPTTQNTAVATGTTILYDAEAFTNTGNSENAALYAVFPYQLFGVGLPELQLARDSYDARRFKSSTCWGQDGMDVAILGWPDRAKAEVTANFTAYSDNASHPGGERFVWFWKKGHDWEPDCDNGGAGQEILQLMLMQNRGDKILLFPAWPKEWNVDFKLHAPKNTTIECVYRNGKVEKLTVTPAGRARDIVRMDQQNP